MSAAAVGSPSESSAELTVFLGCATPAAWLAAVPGQLDLLLIDHANCEKKAAGAALAALYRYTEHASLLKQLSRLAREELRHFEQVLAALQARRIGYRFVSASRYAAGLRQHIRNTEPERLVDLLLVGAFVEARSCERFVLLGPLLERMDPPLAALYARLGRSEQRHFQVYLAAARRVAADGAASAADLDDRIAALRVVENGLISAPDPEFRFHSGVPSNGGRRNC